MYVCSEPVGGALCMGFIFFTQKAARGNICVVSSPATTTSLAFDFKLCHLCFAIKSIVRRSNKTDIFQTVFLHLYQIQLIKKKKKDQIQLMDFFVLTYECFWNFLIFFSGLNLRCSNDENVYVDEICTFFVCFRSYINWIHVAALFL